MSTFKVGDRVECDGFNGILGPLYGVIVKSANGSYPSGCWYVEFDTKLTSGGHKQAVLAEKRLRKEKTMSEIIIKEKDYLAAYHHSGNLIVRDTLKSLCPAVFEPIWEEVDAERVTLHAVKQTVGHAVKQTVGFDIHFLIDGEDIGFMWGDVNFCIRMDWKVDIVSLPKPFEYKVFKVFHCIKRGVE